MRLMMIVLGLTEGKKISKTTCLNVGRMADHGETTSLRVASSSSEEVRWAPWDNREVACDGSFQRRLGAVSVDEHSGIDSLKCYGGNLGAFLHWTCLILG